MSDLLLTLLQPDIIWENKKANLDLYEKKLSNVAGGQIVVLPEMFQTGFSMKPQLLAEKMDGETVLWMKRIAREKKLVLAGSAMIEEDGKYYNRFLWVLPNGQVFHYDKRHLFAYAEEDQDYTAGEERIICSVNGWKINLMVCYDLRFPVWARQQANKEQDFEYDVLLYVANWPEKRSLAWKTLLQARAIENQCYVLGVNRVGMDGNGIAYNGDSMVIDPLGEILHHMEVEEDMATVKLNKAHLVKVRERFPFWKDADHFDIKM